MSHHICLMAADWPLQFFLLVSPLYHLNHIDWPTVNGLLDIDNVWDRDVASKKAFSVPEAVFLRTREVLNLPMHPVP